MLGEEDTPKPASSANSSVNDVNPDAVVRNAEEILKFSLGNRKLLLDLDEDILPVSFKIYLNDNRPEPIASTQALLASTIKGTAECRDTGGTDDKDNSTRSPPKVIQGPVLADFERLAAAADEVCVTARDLMAHVLPPGRSS